MHGIYDNRLADPDNTSGMAWYWYARDIKVTTLPAAVRAAGGTAAAVSWPVTVGMDLDYNVPELIQVRHRENLELVDALTMPAHLLDGYVKASGKPLSWPIDDDDREGLAEWILGQHQPTLLLLHLADSDSMSHEHGPDSPEAVAAIEHADLLLGRLLDKVAALHLDASTDVVVVSDHGFLPLTQLVNLNAAFKAEGLLQTSARGSVTSWEAYAHSAGGSGYILLKRPDDPAARREGRGSPAEAGGRSGQRHRSRDDATGSRGGQRASRCVVRRLDEARLLSRMGYVLGAHAGDEQGRARLRPRLP